MSLIESSPQIKKDYSERIKQKHGDVGHQAGILKKKGEDVDYETEVKLHAIAKNRDKIHGDEIKGALIDRTIDESSVDSEDEDKDKQYGKKEYSRYLKMTPAQRTAEANKLLKAAEVPDVTDPWDEARSWYYDADETDEPTFYQDSFPSEAELGVDSKHTLKVNLARLVELDPDYDEENEFGDKPYGASVNITDKPPYHDKKEQE